MGIILSTPQGASVYAVDTADQGAILVVASCTAEAICTLHLQGTTAQILGARKVA